MFLRDTHALHQIATYPVNTHLKLRMSIKREKKTQEAVNSTSSAIHSLLAGQSPSSYQLHYKGQFHKSNFALGNY